MIKKIINKIFYIIFPDRCITCNKLISPNAVFCEHDWNQLKYILEPKCKICCTNLVTKINFDSLCANCIKNKNIYFDSCESVFFYNETIRTPILQFKNNDQTHLSIKLGNILAKNLIKKTNEYEIIAPVPLHKSRLRNRKYNQSLLLCKEIIKTHNHLKLYPDLLVRKSMSRSQKNLSMKQRSENVKDSIVLNQKYKEFVKDKKIIIVDDVIASSSTVNECAKVLKKHHVKEVKISAIAKSVNK